MRRPLRRDFLRRLETVSSLEDLCRHRGKWVRLSHCLHVGEHATSVPKFAAQVAKLRSKAYTHRSFNGKVEAAIVRGDRHEVSDLLVSRPGVFARRLDHLVRTIGPNVIIKSFGDVAGEVDTRVLLQLFGHMKTRGKAVTRRMVLPKGGQGKSRILTQELPALRAGSVNRIQSAIQDALEARFAELDPWDNVYIDPALRDCPIPLSLRSASDSLVTLARGTKMPLPEGNDTLRMFIYWVGQDIDLSGFFCNASFTKQDTVAYYNLREGGFGCHSGDITWAPDGASEFIDVDMKKAVAAGHRYLGMSVLVYSGPNFDEHEKCYAGWMTRSRPQSNEIFDPKTVQQRADLTCKSKNAIPVIFDLQERKAIWLDVSTSRGYDNLVRPNNVETNKATLLDTVTGAMNLANKPTLYDLFTIHAQGRANYFVEDPAEADIRFGWDGDVTPYDTTKILSEYL